MPRVGETWWLRRILSANSLAGLEESAAAIVRRIGFRYFVLRSSHPQVSGREIQLHNCPAGWLQYCSAQGLHGALDPMHLLAMQETTPVLWRSWVSRYPDYFAAARRYGLATGATHPVHGPLGDRSSMSFIKERDGVAAEMEILAAISECQLLACYAHRAVARIVRSRLNTAIADTRPIAHAPVLTERERECLPWAATGKTMAEVACALSLSQVTISYHLAKARRKLDALNTRHAISRALKLKLIAAN